MIKDTDEQPEEIYRVKSGKVLSAEVSIPRELGYDILAALGCVHQLRKHCKLCTFGIFMEVSLYIGMMAY